MKIQHVFKVRCTRCHRETQSHGTYAKACYFCGARVRPDAIRSSPVPEKEGKEC